jgi:hypothetical protein
MEKILQIHKFEMAVLVCSTKCEVPVKGLGMGEKHGI